MSHIIQEMSSRFVTDIPLSRLDDRSRTLLLASHRLYHPTDVGKDLVSGDADPDNDLKLTRQYYLPTTSKCPRQKQDK